MTESINEEEQEVGYMNASDLPKLEVKAPNPNSELRKVFWIGFFAYAGVGCRVLLTKFSRQHHSRNSTSLLESLGASFFLANVFGCVVMGAARRLKNIVSNSVSLEFYVGITTGFCGCCTTFSSWDAFVAQLFVQRHFVNGFILLTALFAVAMSSFRFGYHLADFAMTHTFSSKKRQRFAYIDHTQFMATLTQASLQIDYCLASVDTTGIESSLREIKSFVLESGGAYQDVIDNLSETNLKPPDSKLKNRELILVSLLFICCSVAVWTIGLVSGRNSWIAVAFGPFGALLRYFLSKFNSSPKYAFFPLFTFIPNVTASVLYSILEVIRNILLEDSRVLPNSFNIWIEGAIMIGFCGSLSTVSSWINETYSLTEKKIGAAYWYVFATVFTTQVLCIIVFGVFIGSGGTISN